MQPQLTIGSVVYDMEAATEICVFGSLSFRDGQHVVVIN